MMCPKWIFYLQHTLQWASQQLVYQLKDFTACHVDKISCNCFVQGILWIIIFKLSLRLAGIVEDITAIFLQKVYKCLHYFICVPTMCMYVQFLHIKAQHLLVVLVRCGRSERIPIILSKWVWYLVQRLLSLDCGISPSTDLRKLHQMVYWVYCTCKGVSYTCICTETTFILNPYLVVDLRMSCSVGHLSHVFIDMADFKLVENG